jgi:hypothetical protein
VPDGAEQQPGNTHTRLLAGVCVFGCLAPDAEPPDDVKLDDLKLDEIV